MLGTIIASGFLFFHNEQQGALIAFFLLYNNTNIFLAKNKNKISTGNLQEPYAKKDKRLCSWDTAQISISYMFDIWFDYGLCFSLYRI